VRRPRGGWNPTARQAVERGDHTEAHALAAIALADAGDELTAWVAHLHEDLGDVCKGVGQATNVLGQLKERAEWIDANPG
jgi:hypothetical protein